MWDVYIIQSILKGRLYIGYSQNAYFRLEQYHNQGLCKSTKAYFPYKIVRIEKYNSKTDALKREKELKRMKGSTAFKTLLSW